MPLAAFLSRCVYPYGGNPDHPTWDNWTLDFELIHQLILKALFEDVPRFLSELLPARAESSRRCMREPEKQLYDLVVDPGATATFFEIKTFSRLGSHQIRRQLEHLKIGQNVHYVLLGRTATEWSHNAIDAETNGRSKKISYKELIGSLRNTSGVPVAEPYRVALEQQRERIKNQFGDPDI